MPPVCVPLQKLTHVDVRGRTLREFNVSLAPWLSLGPRGGSSQEASTVSAPAGSRVPNAVTAGAVGIWQAARRAGASGFGHSWLFAW